MFESPKMLGMSEQRVHPDAFCIRVNPDRRPKFPTLRMTPAALRLFHMYAYPDVSIHTALLDITLGASCLLLLLRCMPARALDVSIQRI